MSPARDSTPICHAVRCPCAPPGAAAAPPCAPACLPPPPASSCAGATCGRAAAWSARRRSTPRQCRTGAELAAPLQWLSVGAASPQACAPHSLAGGSPSQRALERLQHAGARLRQPGLRGEAVAQVRQLPSRRRRQRRRLRPVRRGLRARGRRAGPAGAALGRDVAAAALFRLSGCTRSAAAAGDALGAPAARAGLGDLVCPRARSGRRAGCRFGGGGRARGPQLPLQPQLALAQQAVLFADGLGPLCLRRKSHQLLRLRAVW